jgi:hypothetical protein
VAAIEGGTLVVVEAAELDVEGVTVSGQVGVVLEGASDLGFQLSFRIRQEASHLAALVCSASAVWWTTCRQASTSPAAW